MFGTYRTVLAVMVVLLHLGGVQVIGAYAVFGFYILSGYLMTLIMQRNYGYTRGGVARYAMNRFLRIYPIYWLSCIFSILLIFWLGGEMVRNYQHSIFMPDDIVSAVKNILLLFPFRYDPRLTPPSWALTVELFFYICIGLGLSRTKSLTVMWFVLSVLYTVALNVIGMSWEYRYFAIPAASLPFSTGALVYHYRSRLADVTWKLFGREYAPFLLFLMMIANWYLGGILGTLRGSGFYVNYVLCALIVISLSERQTLPFISRGFDKMMGDFSYPIYLVHYQVGLVVLAALTSMGIDPGYPQLQFAVLSLPFIFLAAWLMSRYVEIPIELVRSRIKAAGKSASMRKV